MYIIYYNNNSTLHESPKVGTTLMWQSGKVAMWQINPDYACNSRFFLLTLHLT